MTPRQKAFVIAALRKASYRWPGRYLAFKASNRGRNQYECAYCHNIFPKKEVALDHINPVTPVEGFKNGADFDLHEYAERMLVEQEGWQVLCKQHHKEKTEIENSDRRKNKAKKKKK